LMKYAPPEVEFVHLPHEADLHILDFIGQHPFIEDKDGLMKRVPSLPKCPNYVLLYHCGSGLDYRYQPLFENAVLVVSYLKPEWPEEVQLDWSKIKLFHTPWGYKSETFYYDGAYKDILCLMTGYVSETSANLS